MTQTIEISATEAGVIRLFRIDESADPDVFTGEEAGDALRAALGAERLSMGPVEVLRVSDLEGIGLAGYLEDGQGISKQDLAPLRGQLDAITGRVVVIPSSAFENTAQTLTPRAPLRHVATLNEDREEVRFEPLPGGTATGTMSGTTASTPPHQGSVNRLILIACAMALAIIVIAALLMLAT